ncbi:MAG: hypothetical protein ABWY51_09240 [Gaiellaceae bacterium]
MEAAQVVEPVGLAIDQLAANTPVSGYDSRLLVWILGHEINAGRVVEANGHYSLAEGWDPGLVDALRGLQDGHPDARLARDRVREAFQQAPPALAPLAAAGR